MGYTTLAAIPTTAPRVPASSSEQQDLHQQEEHEQRHRERRQQVDATGEEGGQDHDPGVAGSQSRTEEAVPQHHQHADERELGDQDRRDARRQAEPGGHAREDGVTGIPRGVRAHRGDVDIAAFGARLDVVPLGGDRVVVAGVPPCPRLGTPVVEPGGCDQGEHQPHRHEQQHGEADGADQAPAVGRGPDDRPLGRPDIRCSGWEDAYSHRLVTVRPRPRPDRTVGRPPEGVVDGRNPP
ncbi:MAG: hypothetical protein U5R31_09765 [Acidimicrobiia bacterium]|nr:hypothetical protein [Acidimicrobiia bacterium]